MTFIFLVFSLIMGQKSKERLSEQIKNDMDRFEQNKKVVQELHRQLLEAQNRLEQSRQDVVGSLKKIKKVYDSEGTESEFKIV